MTGSTNRAFGLIEGNMLYGVIFDEELAHEIASEYDFDLEDMTDDFLEIDTVVN